MDCCPTPLQSLCEVAGSWRKLEHPVVHNDPEHSKHAQLVTYLVHMQAMEELGHFQLLGIVYRSLRRGAVRKHDSGTTMGLRISSRYPCAFKLPLIKCNYVRCL